MTSPNLPVLIIGAGPAGLATAVALKERGIPFRIIDAGSRPGGIWDIERDETPMYQTAHFISSKTQSGFPGFPMPDSYPDYPRHDLILDYIESYAEHHGLLDHISFGQRVVEAEMLDGRAMWRVKTADGAEWEGQGLCVATGMTWHPRGHPLAGRFTGDEFHSFEYFSPTRLTDKKVLVVGGGNSGVDIACDAAVAAKSAAISLRRGYHFVPKYVFGMPSDVFAHSGPNMPTWLESRVFGFLLRRVFVGDLRQYGLPAPDHPLLASHPIVNSEILHLLAHGELSVRPDVTDVNGDRVTFADDSSEVFEVIIWATGYEWRFPFLSQAPVDPSDLYLKLFDRVREGVCFIGYFETDGAAYSMFSQQAQAAAAYFSLLRSDAVPQGFERLRTESRPPLHRGRRYVESPRHDHYVSGVAYERALARATRLLGISE